MKKLSLLTLIVAAGVIYYFQGNFNKLPNKPNELITAPTAAISYGDLSSTIFGRGKVKANRTVFVTPSVAGKIVDIPVKVGSLVTKGQCILKIDLKPESKFRILDLKQRILANNSRKRDLTKQADFQQKLSKEGLVSQIELESLESQIKWTEIKDKAFEDELQILDEQLGLTLTKAKLLESDISKIEKSCINSIIDGTVLDVSSYVGDTISSSISMHSIPIMTIADLSKYYINYTVNELDLGEVKVGQLVEITFDSIPDKIFHGEIESIDSKAFYEMQPGMFTDASKKMSQYKTKIRITDATSEIRSDLSCRVSIKTATKFHILLAPVTSVFTNEDGEQFTLVQQGEGMKHRRIQAGIADFFMIEILSGLHEGDIVFLNPYEIMEQQRILEAAKSKTLLENILH